MIINNYIGVAQTEATWQIRQTTAQLGSGWVRTSTAYKSNAHVPHMTCSEVYAFESFESFESFE